MNYFDNIKTIEELKKEYRKLAFKHHPDRGGDAEIMKEINSQYDKMFDVLKQTSNTEADHKAINDEFKDIINKIIGLGLDLNIEICGSWIWVSGNTKQYKDELNSAGLWWANKKKMWYWHSKDEPKKKRKSTLSMNEIREKYGSEKITQKIKVIA